MNSWIELDLEVLTQNIKTVKEAVRPGTEIIFVVKSGAYGHGMVPVAEHAERNGIRWFAVSYTEEALRLRHALPEANILVVGVVREHNVSALAENRITPLVVSPGHARALSDSAKREGVVLECHLKIDTGMGRLGFNRHDLAAEVRELLALDGIRITGTCSHFATSDSDRKFADIQYNRFEEALSVCRAAGMDPGFRHMSNSGAVLCDDNWQLDGVRPGILMYGCAAGSRIKTEPFLTWKTTVVQVRKAPRGFPVSYDSTYITERATCIATLDAGYADGYPRMLSNRAEVLIRGKRRPVAGRVTMNLITVDVGPDTDVREGDEAVLMGGQQDEYIHPSELAELCGTIPYEILTGIRSGPKQD